MSDQQALVARQFGAQAQAYVQSAAHSFGPDLETMAAVGRAMCPARVLDLGCGGGHASYAVAPFAGEVVACDLLRAMTQAVAAEAERRGLANIATAVAPAEALPFADGAFEMLVCRLTAHHWRDWAAGLAEARRVLAPDARALFSDTVAPASALVDSHLQAIELLRDPSHVRNRTIAEWERALAAAGFAVTAVHVTGLPLDFASWTARMRTPEPERAAIRRLLAGAPSEVCDTLGVQPDGSFTIPVALIEATAV